MPRKKTPEALLLQPKNQSTQCNFYLKETDCKASQSDKPFIIIKLLHPQETQTEFGHHVIKNSDSDRQVPTDHLKRNAESDFGLPSSKKFKPLSNLDIINDYILQLRKPCIILSRKTNSDGILYQIEVIREDSLTSDYFDSPIRLLFSKNGILTVVILFKPYIQKPIFTNEDNVINYQVIDEALSQLSSNFVFCPGILEDDCTEVVTKNLQNIVSPVKRWQSCECPIWFEPPSNVPREQLQSGQYQCRKCRYLKRYMLDERKRKASVTPRTKIKRLSALSRCRISVLTPKSKRKRIFENRKHRSILNKKIKLLEKKLDEASLKLSDKQHAQMQVIVSELNSKGKSDLEQGFKEASDKNKMLGEALKKSWELESTRNGFTRDHY